MIPLMKTAFSKEYETKKALADFIISAPRLSMNRQCEMFEREFADFQGAKDAILFNSGGSANLAMFQTLKNLGKLSDGELIGRAFELIAQNIPEDELITAIKAARKRGDRAAD